MTEIQTYLFSRRDLSYRDFNAKLIPNIDKNTVIGVRAPVLRSYARQLAKSEKAAAFLCSLPHAYFEEDQLHALLLEDCRDEETLYAALEDFLPHIDNWATCDMLSPKRFDRCPPTFEQIRTWLQREHTYTARFGLNMLMKHYLGENFTPDVIGLALLADREGDHYLKMGLSWFFATALTKQYEAALPYFEEARLSLWVHNKAISKACDSRRIPPERKDALRKLRTVASR